MPARFKEKDGVRIYPDGREVCYTQKAWDRRRAERIELAEFRCECTGECGLHQGRRCNRVIAVHQTASANAGDAHHTASRGIGGGRRDDRLEKIRAFCRMPCHTRVTEKERFKGLRKLSES
jgi:hypothetical protein